MAQPRLRPLVRLLLVLWCTIVLAAAAEQQSLGRAYIEKHGNSTYDCAPSGPCISCSSAERQNGEYQCGTTDYHQAYKCSEILAARARTKTDVSVQEKTRAKKERSRKNGPSGEAQADPEPRLDLEVSSGDPAPAIVYYIYNSCLPAVQEDRLSVLGFEMIMLAVLAVCGPVVHYRKKKQYSANGMTRVPTSARF